MSNPIKRLVIVGLLYTSLSISAHAHNVGNAITWNREISRVMYQRCASCHHPGGTAFSLMTFSDVQPNAVAIKQAMLSRRMPPWGAVKGFGDFQDDQGLTQAELELITDWVDSDTPRGNNPNALPEKPRLKKPASFKIPKNAIALNGDLTLDRELTLNGLIPQSVPAGASIRIVASLPSGETEPLVWLYEYKDSYQHPFLFRESLTLPAGTVIHGVPAGASILLLPGKARKSK